MLLGNRLTGSTCVTFNSTAAAFIVVSDTEITAAVSTGATGDSVSATTPPGTLTAIQYFSINSPRTVSEGH